jgi:uncharacterized membrane protein YphA (DoxX/SURF4 family)
MTIALSQNQVRFLVFIRVLLGAVFLLSFSYKLANPAALPGLIERLPLVPEMPKVAYLLLGWLIVGLEGSIGIALVLGQHLQLALALAVVLPLLFAVAVSPFFDALNGDCGCFWKWVPFSPNSGVQLIVRNVLLASTALWGYQCHQLAMQTNNISRAN